ncbi:MAG: 50S ribosomal protein L29 [Anaerolineales bacterium]
MTAEEIRALSADELKSKLDDAREELFKLRFQYRSGQLKDYTRLRVTRHNIARYATVLREREIAATLAGKEK